MPSANPVVVIWELVLAAKLGALLSFELHFPVLYLFLGSIDVTVKEIRAHLRQEPLHAAVSHLKAKEDLVDIQVLNLMQVIRGVPGGPLIISPCVIVIGEAPVEQHPAKVDKRVKLNGQHHELPHVLGDIILDGLKERPEGCVDRHVIPKVDFLFQDILIKCSGESFKNGFPEEICLVL